MKHSRGFLRRTGADRQEYDMEVLADTVPMDLDLSAMYPEYAEDIRINRLSSQSGVNTLDDSGREIAMHGMVTFDQIRATSLECLTRTMGDEAKSIFDIFCAHADMRGDHQRSTVIFPHLGRIQHRKHGDMVLIGRNAESAVVVPANVFKLIAERLDLKLSM